MTKRKGFTIVEIIVSIIVLAALAGVAISVINPTRFTSTARDSKRMTGIKIVQTALEFYYSANGSYVPEGTTHDEITALHKINAFICEAGIPGKYCPTYMDEVPTWPPIPTNSPALAEGVSCTRIGTSYVHYENYFYWSNGSSYSLAMTLENPSNAHIDSTGACANYYGTNCYCITK
jgi:prepilin-type N-terminal cleavage/methylation domain-containing protein